MMIDGRPNIKKKKKKERKVLEPGNIAFIRNHFAFETCSFTVRLKLLMNFQVLPSSQNLIVLPGQHSCHRLSYRVASNPDPPRHRIYDRQKEGLGKPSFCFASLPTIVGNISTKNSDRRLKDLLDFTCMIADKFSKDAKVKLTLFQKIGQKRFGVYAIVSFVKNGRKIWVMKPCLTREISFSWTLPSFFPFFLFSFLPPILSLPRAASTWTWQRLSSLVCTCVPRSFSRQAWFHNPDFSSVFHKTDDDVDAETFLPDFLE